MKRYESKYNPAAKELSDYIHKGIKDRDIRPDVLAKITSVLDGVERMDEMISQKEQLLVQKEKELVRLKSITDNSSKVARDVISESKGNLDQALSLHKLGKFSEALKYSDIALYNIGDINNFGVKTVEQANKLYVERKQQHIDSAVKRDNLYNSSVVSSGNKSANAFAWVKDNPTRDFYTFFREALNIPDKEQKSPDNVRIIKKLYELLPLYVEEAQRANYFYNEYNKYYDAMTKLQQVVNIHNIRAASSKGLKDYEEALKSCEIALEIDPTSATLVNLKNAVLKEKQAIEVRKVEEEKLLVSQTKEIEKLKEILALKEVETQEKNKLLIQKGNELDSKEKVLLDQHKKETEVLKALLAQKELEHQELLARKVKEVKELEKVKNELLKKELLEILPQAYPAAKGSGYNKPFAEWDTSWWGRQVIDAGNFEEIERYLPELREKAAKFKGENLEKQAKELENTKRLQEENIKKEQLLANQNKLLSDKEQRIEELKALIEQSKIEKEELLAQQELAVSNKSHIKNQIIDGLVQKVNLKENEVVDLRIQNLEKELITQQKEKLLIQKETEIQEKSFAKNQVIGDLQEDVGLKEKEAYKLQIELLTKQLEAAREIGKQKKINTELLEQNEILDLKMQYYDMEIKNKEAEKEIFLTQKQKLSFLVSQKEQEFQNLLIQKEIEQKELLIAKELAVADKSFIKNQVIEQLREEIEGLNKQLSDNQPIYRSIYLEERSCQPGESLVERQMASLDLSSINFSPINHGGQNQIVSNIIGNFDNQHITHSIYSSGEGSSFDIIDVENFH